MEQRWRMHEFTAGREQLAEVGKLLRRCRLMSQQHSTAPSEVKYEDEVTVSLCT